MGVLGAAMILVPLAVSQEAAPVVGAVVGILFTSAAILVGYRNRDDQRRDKRGRPLWVGSFLGIAIIVGIPGLIIFGGAYGLALVGGMLLTVAAGQILFRRYNLT